MTNASTLLKPGGTLVYCTCSLEPEEGEQAIARLLAADSSLARKPIQPDELSGHAELITADGDLRTLPSHFPHDDPKMAGLDGFFASRLVKR
jgi:16S rRNA (cytosine967-C5)-methyltransferase